MSWSVILAKAADKGEPPATFEQILAARQPALSGCFVETSATGTFLAAGNRTAAGGLGFGCDARLGLAVIGGGFRGDFAEAATSGTGYAKLGLAINPHLHAYGLLAWVAPDWKLKNVGQLHLGAGLETSVLFNGLSGFAEGSTAVSKVGTSDRNDVLIRLGLRYRFQ
jgi:hypothetical protein